MGTAPGVVQPTRRRLTVHDTAQRVPQDIKGDILKMLRDLLGYARSYDSCNLLLLTGYLLIMSQGQFDHFMCHLTVLEAGYDGKARLDNETSSKAK